MGKTVRHFKCNYCPIPKYYQGPSNSTILKHLRNGHSNKYADLLPKEGARMNSRGFVDKVTLKFNEDVFMGKLLKWIIKSDQAFSVVDNPDLEDVVEYLKKDVGVQSRRTIMRRLEDLYFQKKGELEEMLIGIKSKYSITCMYGLLRTSFHSSGLQFITSIMTGS